MGGEQSKRVFSQIIEFENQLNANYSFTCNYVFADLTTGCGGSLIEKTAKFASHLRSATLRFLRWSVISQKRTKIVDVS